MGCKNRLTPAGDELESLPLPETLYKRIEKAARKLAAVN
jgi:hypothetical protein